MSKHTPGPWTEMRGFICAADGFEVAQMPICHFIRPTWEALGINHWADKPGESFIDRPDEENASNAAVIAAAPDLLESCKELHAIVMNGMTDDYDAMTEALGRASRAIAKAEAE